MWALTGLYVLILRHFSGGTTALDLGPITTGYIGVLLIGQFLIAVGVLTSSLTKNQVTAALMSFDPAQMAAVREIAPTITRGASSGTGDFRHRIATGTYPTDLVDFLPCSSVIASRATRPEASLRRTPRSRDRRAGRASSPGFPA